MTPQLRSYARVAAAIATLFVAAACGADTGAGLPSTGATASPPVATPSSAPSATAGASPRATGSCGSTTLSIDYAPYTTATLAGYGWDFVLADVVGFEPAIFNTPDGSRPSGFGTRPSSPNPNHNAQTLIYTPVNVVIDRAISGPSSPGPSQFLVEGGTVGCYTMFVDVAPRVSPGSRYVFILTEAMDSAGEHPLPLDKAVFSWPVDAGGTVTTPDGQMSIDQLTQVVRAATPSPK